MIWWIGTVFILNHYSGKSSRKRSWIILSLPLVYFLIQFQPLFLNIFSSFLESEPILFSTLYTLAFTLSKPIGGILFSLVFLSIAKKLGNNDRVKKYIIISAFGLVLVFVSNQATVSGLRSLPSIWTCDNFMFGIRLIPRIGWNLFVSIVCSTRFKPA